MAETLTSESAPVEMQIRKSNRADRAKVDFAAIPTVGFAMVDEHVYAAIRDCSEKVIQRERQEGTGCKYKRIGGRTIRYRIGDIMAFLEAQPGGGGGNIPIAKRGPGRPKKGAG
jgi:hypothetical protein